ncbi:MAG: response regulator [Janthinobacterium lividum]
MPKLTSVLLVDDDSTTNYLNSLLFKRLDITQHLFVAENGREALATLSQTCPSPTPSCPALILLDINMPVMNGIEFLEAYQHLPLTQRQAIVVVLLTTSVSPRDLTRVENLPIAGTLTKPLTESKLTSLLQQYFPALAAS